MAVAGASLCCGPPRRVCGAPGTDHRNVLTNAAGADARSSEQGDAACRYDRTTASAWFDFQCDLSTPHVAGPACHPGRNQICASAAMMVLIENGRVRLLKFSLPLPLLDPPPSLGLLRCGSHCYFLRFSAVFKSRLSSGFDTPGTLAMKYSQVAKTRTTPHAWAQLYACDVVLTANFSASLQTAAGRWHPRGWDVGRWQRRIY